MYYPSNVFHTVLSFFKWALEGLLNIVRAFNIDVVVRSVVELILERKTEKGMMHIMADTYTSISAQQLGNAIQAGALGGDGRDSV